jgi:NTE family protein
MDILNDHTAGGRTMEPTIRKGEQSRDEIDQPEAAITEALLQHDGNLGEVQPDGLEQSQLPSIFDESGRPAGDPGLQAIEDYLPELTPVTARGESRSGQVDDELRSASGELQAQTLGAVDRMSVAEPNILHSWPEDFSQDDSNLPLLSEDLQSGETTPPLSSEDYPPDETASPLHSADVPLDEIAVPLPSANLGLGDTSAPHLSENLSPYASTGPLHTGYLSTDGTAAPLPEADVSLDGASTPLPSQDLPDDESASPLIAEDLQREASSAPLPSVDQRLDDSSPPLPSEYLPLPAFEDVQPESTPRKVALVLSGGGARGAFQVGAEKYAREVKGYQWDIIAGVSVGAMNGAMLSMHRYSRLLELWDHLSNDQVYTGGFNFISLVKILIGAKSFYGNEPLKKLLQQEFQAGRIIDDLHVGAVSLTSGEYVQFTRESLELSQAILASASIPVVWPPVAVSPDYPAMVDGGVRNLTPIGDVLEQEPDEIVIINCSPHQPPAAPDASSNVLSIGLRALDLMQNEIFVNDLKEFLRINALVKEAEQQGAVLHHPRSGRLFKYYPCQVIEPEVELGDTLDFSQKSIQAALKAGVRRARQVLGRP